MNEIITKIQQSINDLVLFIQHLPQPYNQYSGLILMGLGVLLALWGYKMKKITLFIIGFTIGGTIALYIGDYFSISNMYILLIMIFSLGLIGGILTTILYFAGFIVIGIYIGITIASLLHQYLHVPETLTFLIAVIISVIIGILSINIDKLVFILLTSYYGFVLFKIGLSSNQFFIIENSIQNIISICVLIGGLVFQFVTHFHINKETKKEIVKEEIRTIIEKKDN